MSMFRIDGLASGMDTYQMVEDLMKAHRKPVDKLLEQRQVLEWQREDYRTLNSLLLNFRTNTVADMRLDAGLAITNAESSNPAVATATASGASADMTYNLQVDSLATHSYYTSETLSGDDGKFDANASLVEQLGIENGHELKITTYDYDNNPIEREFVITETTSLNQLLRQISADKELGVNAFYDAGADQVSFATTRTGENNPDGQQIKIEGFLAGGTETAGQNAKVTVNGMEITRPTNDFVLNNTLFSLKGVTGDATITVARDTDAMVDKIKHFVQEYNGLLDIINGKLNEERFRDYPPLVNEDDQQGLTDRQIDQWEQKARSGLLRHDSMLSGVVNRLRNEAFSKVDGLDDDMNHLAHIGITVGSFYDRGKLVIDESKLRQAVEQDPDGAAKIFNNRSTDTAKQGIAQRLYGSLDNAIKQVTARAGSLTSPLSADQSWIGRQIGDLNKRVEQAESRLERMEDTYWRQFAAMEQALNQMNAQSAWLSQQMGALM